MTEWGRCATGATCRCSTSGSNRLVRWSTEGLLCLGDAAHAMSPVGGVGINLAIQDAVAAARLLATPLRHGALTRGDLDRVQLRRWATPPLDVANT